MIKKLETKIVTLITALSFFLVNLQVNAFASGNINTGFNPKSNGTTIGNIISAAMQWGVKLIAAVAGGWFLLHLYWAITKFTASGHNAQKREDAKGHVIHVIVSGVLGGAAVVIASAVWNWGAGL